jgi:hypothetical protein
MIWTTRQFWKPFSADLNWTAIDISDCELNEPFPVQGPQKFTQIGIFGLKTKHLATLPVNKF